MQDMHVHFFVVFNDQIGSQRVKLFLVHTPQRISLKNMKKNGINTTTAVQMPKWFEKILKYNPREKSLKAPFAIYLDLEYLLKKEQSCQNNPEKSQTEKKLKHEPSGWGMLTKCSFDKTEDKLDYYRGKDYIEKLCKKLKEHAMKIINY